MADLFDALVARALEVGPALTPVLPPRFADRTDSTETVLEFSEPIARDDVEPAARPSSTDRSQPDLGAPPTPAPRAQPAIPPPAPPLVAWPLDQPRIDAGDRPVQAAEPDRRESVATRAPATAVDHGSDTSPIERLNYPTVDHVLDPTVDPTVAPVARTAAEAIVAAPIPPRIEPIRAVPLMGPAPAAAPDADYPSEQAAPAQVTVSIGRVELRAPVPREPARSTRAEPTRWPQPRLSLDDYLRRGPGR